MALFNIPKQTEFPRFAQMFQDLEHRLQISSYSLYGLKKVLSSAKKKLLYEIVNQGLENSISFDCLLDEIDSKITMVDAIIIYLEDMKIFQLREQELRSIMDDLIFESEVGQLLLQYYQNPKAFYHFYVQELTHGRAPMTEAPSCFELFEYYKTIDKNRLPRSDFTVILYLAYCNTNITFPPDSMKVKMKKYFSSI